MSEGARSLPGMTRSVAWTLTRLWDADYILADRDHETARLRDLMSIEARVRARLPTSILSPPDLRNAALQRVSFAPAVLGSVELDRVVRVAPIWRPLLTALGRQVRVTWRSLGSSDVSWFAGELVSDPQPAPASPEIVSCASPRAEAVEALRWANS
jgi:hypothetical protein